VARLLVDGKPVDNAHVARSLRDRSRGLLGRAGIVGGLAIVPTSSVPTVRMRFAIDVAFVCRDGIVLKVVTMKPNRLGAWRPRSRWVLETEAGQMAVLGIRPGGRIELDEDVSG